MTGGVGPRERKTTGVSPPTVLALSWLIVTVSMGTWWLVYGLMQLHQLGSMTPDKILQHQRMLYWEGGAFLALLIGGGLTLVYYTLREVRRHKQVQEFYATLTHELKTPLASLRLQAEVLAEEITHIAHKNLIDRLVKDTLRLEMQMQNALGLASDSETGGLHLQEVQLSRVLMPLKSQWPELTIDCADSVRVVGDERALESVFKNMIQNARIHGQANNIHISVRSGPEHAEVHIKDDGKGFRGNSRALGRLFLRPTPTSGSGVGLYLVTRLVGLMGGKVHFESEGPGFIVRLQLQEARR